jgi:hypothetical protein
MSFHSDNMADVREWGDLLPEDWYHVRISKIIEKLSVESQEPTVYLTLVCQEEPMVGQVIPDNCSLQPHALAKLKAYYSSTGKGLLPNGHDPELLKDGECWVKLVHVMGKTKSGTAEKRGSIPPYGIKPFPGDGKPLS